jgi:hypothetical protein
MEATPMTYGYLKTLNTPWTMSHVIDDFCSNARFCNKNGWRNDAVSEYEIGILNHWAAKEGYSFPLAVAA